MSLRGARLNGGGGGGAPSGTGIVTVTGGALNAPGPLTGDVTTVAGGLVTTIAANAVTLAKMAQVATGRFLGRLTAGVGDVEALTGTQATSLLDVFVTALKGLVPAPGAVANKYLRDDGTWQDPPGTFVSTFIGLGFFGDASDGSANFDGVATVLGIAPAAITAYGSIGSVKRYILTRDMHFDDLTVAAGVLLITNYRVFVRGTLIGPGSGVAYIGYPGVNGAVGGAGTPGAGGSAGAAGTLAAQVPGGAGGTTGSGVASGGTVQSFGPPGYSNTGGGAGAAGTNGTAGGTGKGGGGGGGTTATGAAGGAMTIVADSEGSLSNLVQALQGRTQFATNRYSGGSGGGGGGGTAVGNGTGGGGGGGGGNCIVCAREITNAARVTLLSTGGNGGNAYQGAVTGGQKCGGGGGGGAGWIVCVIGTGSFPVTLYTGGIGGAANPAGGGIGGAGGDGYARLFRVGA